MKSNSFFFTTLTLAAPLAFLLQTSDLAQAKGGGGGGMTPPAQDAEAVAPAPAPSPRANPSLRGSDWVWVAPAPAPSPRANVEFFFPGGTPFDFVNAVEKQYKADWKKVVDIPDNMRDVHIPALRMNQQSVESMYPVYRGGGGRGGGGGGGGGGGFGGGGRGGFGATPEELDPLNALISLYNSLGQAKPELGRLMVEGDLAKPSVVIFHSTYANTVPELKMKAFALGGIQFLQWDKLADEIRRQTETLGFVNHSTGKPANVEIHRDSSLLIVVGNAEVLEAAESLVAAWRDNYSSLAVPRKP